jgi:hypothetical protein
LRITAVIWIQIFLKSLHVKDLVFGMVATGSSLNLEEVGPSGMSFGHWPYTFEGDNGTPVPSSSSPFYIPALRRPVCSTTCFCNEVLPQHRPQSKGVKWPWTETSQTKSQNKPLPFFVFVNWLFQVGFFFFLHLVCLHLIYIVTETFVFCGWGNRFKEAKQPLQGPGTELWC